jgi:hypothetical protein
VFLPINVNHKQHGGTSWFIPNGANCVPALLSRYTIDTIWSDQASLVLEDESGQLEGDSAVILLISEILGLVPFIPHVVYTNCITHTARCGEASAAHMEGVGMSDNSARALFLMLCGRVVGSSTVVTTFPARPAC